MKTTPSNWLQWLPSIAALASIALSAILHSIYGEAPVQGAVSIADTPLLLLLATLGMAQLFELIKKALRADFGSDLLAGVSIATGLYLGEYMAAAMVTLMLSGGQALESYALRKASSALQALASRLPSVAHRKNADGVVDIPIDQVVVGDLILVYPHEACPADGTVVEGHGVMDESYLTGEPYVISKAPGSAVLSGSMNGHTALLMKVTLLPNESRYSQIMRVMRESEQQRPRMRRIADALGAVYTPVALVLAAAAGWLSGDPVRFLAVVVVATPCPLIIAIPIVVMGAISLAARKGIIIRDPAVLERIDRLKSAVFDKTGTLTYGKPALVEYRGTRHCSSRELLGLAASLERYSKHPLAFAVQEAALAAGIIPREVAELRERPGEGLTGIVGGQTLQIVGRSLLAQIQPKGIEDVPVFSGGMECMLLVDGVYSGWMQFRDQPRHDGAAFIEHLRQVHQVARIVMLTGDRETEAHHLAKTIGITEVLAGQSPEEKLEFVRQLSAEQGTLFMGDGINDAPALAAATVGVAFGGAADVASAAAGAVILNSSLESVDELWHIGRRMRHIALQCALGGMAASLIAMGFSAYGYLPPVAGSLVQEVIDVVAVLNALRMSIHQTNLTDMPELRKVEA